MFSRILVPLDGSEIAKGILPYVAQLAKRLNASIVLYTAMDPDSIYVYTSTAYRPRQATPNENSDDDSASDDVRGLDTSVTLTFRSQLEIDNLRNIKSELEGVSKGLANQGIATDVRTTLGPPAEQILATAEAEGCDLIALATHGRNAIGRGLLGSVTDRVTHLSTLPVLTVSPSRVEEQPSDENHVENVIVPLDGSEMGEAVLPVVEGLAKAMSLRVHLVRAFDPAEYDRRHRYTLALAGIPSASQEIEARHKEYLESLADGLASRGIDVETETLTGPAAAAIVEYARKSPQDIVVMATHGRSGFRRLLLGSVTEAVIRSSGDPVLIIPPRTSNLES